MKIATAAIGMGTLSTIAGLIITGKKIGWGPFAGLYDLSDEVKAIAGKYDVQKYQHGIIFYGASNFRLWKKMENDLKRFNVQNHGFGGSTDKMLLKYADDILYPYHPNIVFLQTGSNDYVNLSGSDEEKVNVCMAFKKKMYEEFHEKLPETRFVVMSGLLLPGRSQYTALTQRINESLKKLCDETEYLCFVDASDMTFDGTDYAEELFISDGIHLNHEGQLRWCEEYIRPQIERMIKNVRETVNRKYYLAIDIGASSGRHIVGWRENGELHTEEVYRFANEVTSADGHLIWNIEGILDEVKQGIRAAQSEFGRIESLSIDTWGVDYVLMNEDKEIFPCYAYRDSRTQESISQVHEKIPFSELYRHTGCQFQSFNTIYQLYDDLQNGRLDKATDFLMLPEYLMYRLTGIKAREYTNATTTGMINAQTNKFDTEIIRRLGLPERLFPKLQKPGTVIGDYEGIKVMLCATHDTASAVEGISMEGNHPYISSGTWSLLGVKTPKPLTDAESEKANYSNEGGVGYNRYQKNIMGMWLVNQLQKELCPTTSFSEITGAAEKSECGLLVDANASEFLAPDSMKNAFDSATDGRLHDIGDYFRCAYRSLAESYRAALEELEQNTGVIYQKLYIVGGGAKNQFLNDLTAQATGKEVIALPIEATALGNLKIQMGI